MFSICVVFVSEYCVQIISDVTYSYGFALEECRERDKAEEVARRALAIDKRTPFATHAMCKPKNYTTARTLFKQSTYVNSNNNYYCLL